MREEMADCMEGKSDVNPNGAKNLGKYDSHDVIIQAVLMTPVTGVGRL